MKALTQKGKITKEMMRKFLDLACQLSPENLACDGELPADQVHARRKQLLHGWKMLEVQVGRKVSEDEVWANALEV